MHASFCFVYLLQKPPTYILPIAPIGYSPGAPGKTAPFNKVNPFNGGAATDSDVESPADNRPIKGTSLPPDSWLHPPEYIMRLAHGHKPTVADVYMPQQLHQFADQWVQKTLDHLQVPERRTQLEKEFDLAKDPGKAEKQYKSDAKTEADEQDAEDSKALQAGTGGLEKTYENAEMKDYKHTTVALVGGEGEQDNFKSPLW